MFTKFKGDSPLYQRKVLDCPPLYSKVITKEGGLNLLCAITPKERQTGLSNRDSLPKDSGMLFLFDRPDIHLFWMKDMNFPIDIFWISEEGKIISIERQISPESFPATFTSSSPAKYVLETNISIQSMINIKTLIFSI